MILLTNVENTNILIGCADERKGSVIFESEISTDPRKTITEYMIILKQIIEVHGIDISELNGGIIASCVPSVTDILKDAMKQLLHVHILEVGPGIKTGVDIRIDDPAELGADLIAAAAAGINEYGAPLVIINLTTLTTLSVINAQRHFIGAIFQPGIRLSAESVSQSAANLSDIAIRQSAKLIGSNTAESIQSGVIYGCCASVDGLLDRISRELDTPDLTSVITGRYAQLIAANCRHQIFTDMRLGLKGLIYIYNKNRRQRN